MTALWIVLAVLGGIVVGVVVVTLVFASMIAPPRW